MLRSATGAKKKACVRSTGGGQDTSRAQFLCHLIFTARPLKNFPFSWEYLELLQISCSEKKGLCSWKPILENSTQEIDQDYIISKRIRFAGAQVRSCFPLGQREGWWGDSLRLSWPLDPCFSLWAGSRPSNAFLWRVFTLCVFCINHLPSMLRAGGWSMRNASQLFPAGLNITTAAWWALIQSSGPGQGFADCCEQVKDLAAKF